MTALTASQAAPPAQQPRPPVSKAERVAASLKSIRENLLAPFEAWQAIRRPFGQKPMWGKGEMEYPGFLDLVVEELEQPRTEDHRASMLGAMDAKFARQPMADRLAALQATAGATLAADFDWKVTRVCVALMIDAFPNARPHSPETYQEALVAQLSALGFQPAVVAKACDAALRSSTFLPAIAEVLEHAEAAQGQLTSIMRTLELYESARAKFDANRKWLVNAEIGLPDRSNYDGPPYRAERGSRWS